MVKRYTCSAVRLIRSEDLMYNMVTIGENTVLYNCKIAKVYTVVI